LLEASVYKDAISKVIAAYFRDYDDHPTHFVPGFLVNDILRLWRTFSVNYEARTQLARTDDERAKRKVKNYKLAHSRMLTCYSALLFLLATFRADETVSRDHIITMVGKTPTARLEWLLKQDFLRQAHEGIQQLLLKYNTFLETTSISEKALAAQMADKTTWQLMKNNAYDFGDSMAAVLNEVGGATRLHRFIVV
jgi:hypothetical protein